MAGPDGNSEAPRALPGPVFIGGTGRSGTHAMSRLLGRHSAFYYFTREMRFHTDKGGFPSLLAGTISADDFVANMRGRFWQRTGADGKPRGLSDRFSPEAWEAALTRFRSEYDSDPLAACRLLMHELLDPLARAAGKEVWIEQTPPTVIAAPTLHAIFPDMRMIHMVRDGRDVACSVAVQHWGPSSPMRALSLWEKRLRKIDAALRQVPSTSVIRVHLDDLVEHKRSRTYRRVLRFLGVENEPRVRRYFQRQMSAEAANIGRWREQLSPAEQRRITRRYRRVLERMERDGIAAAPSLERAALTGEAEDDERSWLARVVTR